MCDNCEDKTDKLFKINVYVTEVDKENWVHNLIDENLLLCKKCKSKLVAKILKGIYNND